MKCKNCPSTEALIDTDPLQSSYLCLDCGYYYSEDGLEETEIRPFCLLVINERLFQPIGSREVLLKVLREYKTSEGLHKIELRKYFTDKSSFRKKTFFL